MNKNVEQIILQNKNVYNKIAQDFFHSRQIMWEELRPLAEYVKPGFRILDLGCGFGRLLYLFERVNIEYVGVDQSEEQIAMAQKTFPNNEFVIGEMRALPFPDASFDLIYCIAAFHHLPDEPSRLQALQEMKRVLKLGGKILMTNWNLHSKHAAEKYPSAALSSSLSLRAEGRAGGKDGDFFVPWKAADGAVLGERYYHAFTPEELRGLFEKVGLAIEDQFYVKKGERSDRENGENIVTIIFR